MREVLEVCKVDEKWGGDIEPIVVTEFLTKNEVKRLAIKNIAKTGYGSGKYAVLKYKGSNLVPMFTFNFYRH